ncbi:histidine phosphatase family protein [Carnobacteriaceae bacterium zg-ZUI252]|nr:histidine phosphatase family protein [Carnobacteriaceae bacterium zg-ZUI252]MBS4770749.1 histidine phosphatase family protein [Carnobacteriaceae bacterium zg-ZUI240]
MGVKLIFMRHAQTYLNKYERMQGWSNAPLTQSGVADCHASGRGLAHVKFDAVYTSDLQRTIDTANIILSENKVSSDLTIVPMYEFREVFFGHFEGLPVKDIWPKVIEMSGKDDDAKKKLLDNMHALDPSGDSENYMAFWLRIYQGLHKLIEQYRDTDKTILVVSHGLALNIMLSAILPEHTFRGPLSNASVTEVTYENGQFTLNKFNGVDHFIYLEK